MKNVISFLAKGSILIILVGCPETTDEPTDPNNTEENIPNTDNDAGSTEGSVDGSMSDAGSPDGSVDGSGLDSGNLDGGVEGSAVDSGISDGSVDGSGLDAGSSAGSTDGQMLDAGSADGTDPVVDAGMQQALNCATLDTVVWKWGGTSGPCGPQNSVTFHANGQIVESLQGFSPEGPNNTCVATERHFEVLGVRTQALIQSVCEDYINNFGSNEGCVGAYSRWVFMDGDEELEQTGNLSCGNTSMAASAAAYETLMGSLMAPNTCEYGCETSDACADGYRCQGAVSAGSEGMGQCIENGVTMAGQGANCGTSDGPCGEGLVCIGDLMGAGWNTPTCEPAWMANTFASNSMLSISDNDAVTDSQVVCGLYTVPMGGILYLDIEHDDLSQLEVSLDNPDGGYLLSFTPTAAILSEGLVITPPTDESVNGTWTLRVEDIVSGSTGTLNGWALYLESWPD